LASLGRAIEPDTRALLPGTRGAPITPPRSAAFTATPPQLALFRGSRRASRTHCPFGPLTLQAVAVIRAAWGFAIASRLEPTCGIYEGRFFEAAPRRAWRQFKLIWIKRRKRWRVG